jgi:uncharacterized protein with HEPN domain
MTGQDFHRLDLILQMIAHLQRRLQPLSLRAFFGDVDEIDLTSFRLAVMGELTSKLDPALKARHPHIQWQAIYAMRNIIVHDYGAIEPERLWMVFQAHVDALAKVCRLELGNVSP